MPPRETTRTQPPRGTRTCRPSPNGLHDHVLREAQQSNRFRSIVFIDRRDCAGDGTAHACIGSGRFPDGFVESALSFAAAQDKCGKIVACRSKTLRCTATIELVLDVIGYAECHLAHRQSTVAHQSALVVAFRGGAGAGLLANTILSISSSNVFGHYESHSRGRIDGRTKSVFPSNVFGHYASHSKGRIDGRTKSVFQITGMDGLSSL
jgi:hypothetical protein